MDYNLTNDDTLISDVDLSLTDFLEQDAFCDFGMEGALDMSIAELSPESKIDEAPGFWNNASDNLDSEELPSANAEQPIDAGNSFVDWGNEIINSFATSSKNMPNDLSLQAADDNFRRLPQDAWYCIAILSQKCSEMDIQTKQLLRGLQASIQNQQTWIQRLKHNQALQQRQIAFLRNMLPAYTSLAGQDLFQFPPTDTMLGDMNIVLSNSGGEFNPFRDAEQVPSPFRGQADTLSIQPTLDPALLRLEPNQQILDLDFSHPASNGGCESAMPLTSFPPVSNNVIPPTKTNRLHSERPNDTKDMLALRSREISRNHTESSENAPNQLIHTLKTTVPDKKARITKPAYRMNNRKRRIADFKPGDHYVPLSSTPDPWVGKKSKEGFSYNPRGELDPGESYSVAQLTDYLYEHPLNIDKHGLMHKGRNGGLRIWIQKCPTDSSGRYPDERSVLCRFEKCIVSDRRILVGHPRLAFDEQSHHQAKFDPFIYAGFVHLFCAEKFLDFPKLVRELDVRVDDRTLGREIDGSNKMKLDYHMLRVANTFIKMCLKCKLPSGYPDPKLPAKWHYRGTLCHRLWRAKLDHECPVRAEARAIRGDRPTQWHNHLGDLEELEKVRSRNIPQKDRRKRPKHSQIIDIDASDREVDAEAETDDFHNIEVDTKDKNEGYKKMSKCEEAIDYNDMDWVP